MRNDGREAFERVLAFVERELGFEAGFYDDAYLDRRVTARMRRSKRETYGEYLRLLRRDEDEREALLDSLAVTVTGFFRDPDAWERLRSVLRTVTAERETVSAWSAPCADGREPYSLAMLALADPEVDAERLSILGTDVNDSVLREARTGTYENTKTMDLADELDVLSEYAPYVEREGESFTVRERVRELIEFERHDLISGDPRGEFDVVLCRNLLIYIDGEYKAPIVETIRESLRPGGYLMVGATETLPAACRGRFEPVDRGQRIYRAQ